MKIIARTNQRRPIVIIEKLDKRKVKTHSMRRLLWFIHHPNTQFEDEIWWCLQSEFQQSASAWRILKIPYGLLKESSIINPNTGKEVGIYYISKSDFNKIKDFWIENYCITDIYNITKEIQQIAKEKNPDIGVYFNQLLNDYYFHFVIYKGNTDKTAHLVYWLNFIMQIFKELKIPKNSPYYEIGFEFKTLKKTKFNGWNWLVFRHKLIHPIKMTKKHKWYIQYNEKDFTVNFEKNSEKDQLIFLWENFHKFLVQTLNKKRIN